MAALKSMRLAAPDIKAAVRKSRHAQTARGLRTLRELGILGLSLWLRHLCPDRCHCCALPAALLTLLLLVELLAGPCCEELEPARHRDEPCPRELLDRAAQDLVAATRAGHISETGVRAAAGKAAGRTGRMWTGCRRRS